MQDRLSLRTVIMGKIWKRGEMCNCKIPHDFCKCGVKIFSIETFRITTFSIMDLIATHSINYIETLS